VATHDCSLYRPRRPEATPLYRLVQCCDGSVRDAWEERYERRYGFWRAAADKAVGAYLDCGLLENGFARVRCGSCRAEYLVAFSSKGRGLCPSCAAKRAAALAAFLREEVLADVGHAQWGVADPQYYGAYSSVVRARRRREEAARGDGAECRPSPPAAEPRDDPELRALRRRWANLIRRIYEVDPLVCPRCGAPMRIIAFIPEPRVIGQILKHLAAKGIDARSPPEAPHNHRPAA
jgi:hypothetical protein